MNEPLAILAVVAVAGAVGGLARYWISGLVDAALGESFPWGILLVNVSGALLVGIAAGLMPASGTSDHFGLGWAAVIVGLLGSYTTVSSFSLQTIGLLRSGERGLALLYVVSSVCLCLAAAAAGLAFSAAGA